MQGGEAVEAALARGDGEAARAALLELLAARTDDPLAALTLRVLTQGRFAPDATAATVDRLVALLRVQEGQLRALRALVEAGL